MNFVKEITSEIHSITTTRKELVKFGLIIGPIFVVLSFILKQYFPLLLTVGIFLLILGMLAPKLLRYPYVAWMSFAVIMGFFMFRVILVILYYLAILPIGLISRVFGRDVLDRDFSKKKESYWIPHTTNGTPNDPF